MINSISSSDTTPEVVYVREPHPLYIEPLSTLPPLSNKDLVPLAARMGRSYRMRPMEETLPIERADVSGQTPTLVDKEEEGDDDKEEECEDGNEEEEKEKEEVGEEEEPEKVEKPKKATKGKGKDKEKPMIRNAFNIAIDGEVHQTPSFMRLSILQMII